MSEYKDDIKKFITDLQKKYGRLPKFCHNLNAPKNKVYYSGPYFDDDELVAGIEAFLFGKWGSSGELCAKFEREFSKALNQGYSFFTNSGSSANLLLIASCKEFFEWKNDDEIILSAVGFPTSYSCVVQNNLKPVFIDIEWDTLNFNLNKIEEKITNKTRAIFLSPVLGNPPDIDKLLVLSNKYKLILLLDGCDSLGSKWDNKHLSEYVVGSTCSLYASHILSSIEGGMVSSNFPEIIDISKSLATWSRACYCSSVANLLPNGSCGKRFSNWLPDFPNLIIDHKYVFDRIGYNLKPLELCGAIGLEQLKKLEWFCQKRILNTQAITSIFTKYLDVRTFNVLPKTHWVPFGVPIICKNREYKYKLVNYLEKNGIQTRNYFAGNILMHKGYKHLDDYKLYPEANKVLDLVFFIGCAPTISLKNINYIEEVVKKFE